MKKLVISLLILGISGAFGLYAYQIYRDKTARHFAQTDAAAAVQTVQSKTQPDGSSEAVGLPEKTSSRLPQPNQTDDNQAKTDLVRKLYLAETDGSADEYLTSAATPELGNLVQQFERFDEKIRQNPDMEIGCDMYPHYYLGFGNGGAPDDLQKTLQIKTVSHNTLRATFKDFDGKRVGADITVRCENGRCLIDDIKTIGNKTSMRTDFQTVLRKQSC